jgi:3-oxoacyl-[acyl-carrier-protein] synthase-3
MNTVETMNTMETGSNQLSEAGQKVLRDLMQVWLQFERQLNKVPIIRRLEQGTFTLADYKTLLLNLRPQVVEGARWITRAASSFDSQHTAVRSVVIHHAMDEHKDFEILERDFVAVGGALSEIRSRQRNIGTEALAAFLFNQASQPNPLDLLGAMFIIEGLGEKMAARWAKRIQELTDVSPDATRFLSYHGSNDDLHLNKLYTVLDEYVTSDELSDRVVKTARVVARLYALQLEELDNV